MIRRSLSFSLPLVLASSVQAQLIGEFELDPRTYTSPSGAVTLFVDPARRFGDGPASYRCARDGREIWSATLPYSFHGAVVDDQGRVAGYAYAAGEQGGEEDAFTVVLLDPDGTVRIEERSPREGRLSDTEWVSVLAMGLFLDPDNDRLVVRVRDDTHAESWWTWSIRSGTRGASVAAEAAFGGEGILGARPVPGTDLTLVDGHPSANGGIALALLDLRGTVVWRSTLADECKGVEATRLLRRSGGTVLGTERGRFTLRRMRTGERVTFEVRPSSSPSGTPDVREVARVPFVGEVPAPEEPAWDSLPEVTLRPLGSIPLGEVGDGRWVGTNRFALGPDDHLYFYEPGAGLVRVFDPEGGSFDFCRLAPEDFEDDPPLYSLDVEDAGGITVFHGGRRFVRFDAEGRRLGTGSSAQDLVLQLRHAQPGTRNTWIVGYQELFLVDRDGAVLHEASRTPDGVWLRGVMDASVAPDGSIALMMTPHHSTLRPGLHLYSATGEPLRSFRVPAEPGVGLAYDGRRLVLTQLRFRSSGSVFLIDAHDGHAERFTPPAPARWSDPLLPRNAHELWLFDGAHTVERFALP